MSKKNPPKNMPGNEKNGSTGRKRKHLEPGNAPAPVVQPTPNESLLMNDEQQSVAIKSIVRIFKKQHGVEEGPAPKRKDNGNEASTSSVDVTGRDAEREAQSSTTHQDAELPATPGQASRRRTKKTQRADEPTQLVPGDLGDTATPSGKSSRGRKKKTQRVAEGVAREDTERGAQPSAPTLNDTERPTTPEHATSSEHASKKNPRRVDRDDVEGACERSNQDIELPTSSGATSSGQSSLGSKKKPQRLDSERHPQNATSSVHQEDSAASPGTSLKKKPQHVDGNGVAVANEEPRPSQCSTSTQQTTERPSATSSEQASRLLENNPQRVDGNVLEENTEEPRPAQCSTSTQKNSATSPEQYSFARKWNTGRQASFTHAERFVEDPVTNEAVQKLILKAMHCFSFVWTDFSLYNQYVFWSFSCVALGVKQQLDVDVHERQVAVFWKSVVDKCWIAVRKSVALRHSLEETREFLENEVKLFQDMSYIWPRMRAYANELGSVEQSTTTATAEDNVQFDRATPSASSVAPERAEEPIAVGQEEGRRRSVSASPETSEDVDVGANVSNGGNDRFNSAAAQSRQQSAEANVSSTPRASSGRQQEQRTQQSSPALPTEPVDYESDPEERIKRFLHQLDRGKENEHARDGSAFGSIPPASPVGRFTRAVSAFYEPPFNGNAYQLDDFEPERREEWSRAPDESVPPVRDTTPIFDAHQTAPVCSNEFAVRDGVEDHCWRGENQGCLQERPGVPQPLGFDFGACRPGPSSHFVDINGSQPTTSAIPADPLSLSATFEQSGRGPPSAHAVPTTYALDDSFRRITHTGSNGAVVVIDDSAGNTPPFIYVDGHCFFADYVNIVGDWNEIRLCKNGPVPHIMYRQQELRNIEIPEELQPDMLRHLRRNKQTAVPQSPLGRPAVPSRNAFPEMNPTQFPERPGPSRQLESRNIKNPDQHQLDMLRHLRQNKHASAAQSPLSLPEVPSRNACPEMNPIQFPEIPAPSRQPELGHVKIPDQHQLDTLGHLRRNKQADVPQSPSIRPAVPTRNAFPETDPIQFPERPEPSRQLESRNIKIPNELQPDMLRDFRRNEHAAVPESPSGRSAVPSRNACPEMDPFQLPERQEPSVTTSASRVEPIRSQSRSVSQSVEQEDIEERIRLWKIATGYQGDVV